MGIAVWASLRRLQRTAVTQMPRSARVRARTACARVRSRGTVRTVAAVLFFVLGAACAFAFDPSELNRITFKNSTGLRIVAIFLTPSDSMRWGPDVLVPGAELMDGAQVGTYLHYPPSSCKFDIVASDEGGQVHEIHNFLVTDESEVSVTFTQKDIVTPSPDFTLAALTIQNDSGHDMQYLFLSPADSKAWGGELLEDQALAAGDTRTVMVPVGKQSSAYNIMCADDNNDQYVSDVTIDPSQGAPSVVSIGPPDLRPRTEK